LYAVEYNKDNNYVLSCLEGPTCEFKLKISVREVEKILHQNHYLYHLNENVFEGKVHELTIFQNDKPHSNHQSANELENEFEKRSKGLSKFAITIVQKLDLYLQKQVDRIDVLKKYLGKDYDVHVPSLGSLSDCCYKLKQVQFGKEFDSTLGDFQELKKIFSRKGSNR